MRLVRGATAVYEILTHAQGIVVVFIIEFASRHSPWFSVICIGDISDTYDEDLLGEEVECQSKYCYGSTKYAQVSKGLLVA